MNSYVPRTVKIQRSYINSFYYGMVKNMESCFVNTSFISNLKMVVSRLRSECGGCRPGGFELQGR
jgi:hypothetical protein